MDQTGRTADFSRVKYVSKGTTTKVPKVVEDEAEPEETREDALLGGIRNGLRTITKTTRESLSTCKSETELDDATAKIEAASLKLMKLEKSFLKTATLVTEIIDDFASDYEEDDVRFGEADESNKNPVGGGDATTNCKQVPHIFHISKESPASIANFKNKLTKELDRRMNLYKETLSDDQLKEEKQFSDLLDQIKLGRKDAQESMKQEEESPKGDANGDYDMVSLLSRLSVQELKDLENYEYEPYDEEKEIDDSVLPTMDPVSKKQIENPVRNKYCHHVYDRASILAYMKANPAATCPVRMCLNCRFLEEDQLVTDAVLTAHVRQKNSIIE